MHPLKKILIGAFVGGGVGACISIAIICGFNVPILLSPFIGLALGYIFSMVGIIAALIFIK